jgi:branched-chain amino acid transport system ATP-binding protein
MGSQTNEPSSSEGDTWLSQQGQRDSQLAADSVVVHFGGLKAVDGVDLQLRRGEIAGLIGPNGAGKTTLLNVLSGYQRPSSGRVLWGGSDVTNLPPYRRSRLGLGRTFQNGRLFSKLSVLENVEASAFGFGVGRQEARRQALTALEVMQLTHRQRAQADSLAYGEQRRLDLARAYGLKPKYLLLDEPAAGLNEAEGADLIASIRVIRDQLGCGVLVVDHDMHFIMELCERIQVLDHGRQLFQGTPAEVQSSPLVIDAYLGTPRVRDDARRN